MIYVYIYLGFVIFNLGVGIKLLIKDICYWGVDMDISDILLTLLIATAGPLPPVITVITETVVYIKRRKVLKRCLKCKEYAELDNGKFCRHTRGFIGHKKNSKNYKGYCTTIQYQLDKIH